MVLVREQSFTKSGIVIPAFFRVIFQDLILLISSPCHIKSKRLTCRIAT